MRRLLTDTMVKALKKTGRQYDVMDSDVRGFGARVSGQGEVTFILLARYPGSKNPTRRSIGVYPDTSLAHGREIARSWRSLIAKGIDPRDEVERLRREEQRRRNDTFEKVVDAYIEDMEYRKLRRSGEVARALKREFVSAWKDRSVTSITRGDVIDVINEIKKRAPVMARNCLAYVRGLFNWAVDSEQYGLESSPCDRTKANKLIGKKRQRTRILDHDELRAYWRAASKMPYPFGPMYQLILLCGLRLREVAQAERSELKRDHWRIPPERMKNNAAHVVPFTAEIKAIFDDLPRFKRGQFLFSTTFGEKAVSGFSKAKARLDRRMLLTWRALNRRERRGKTFDPFQVRDVRRTARTLLSSLPVDDLVRELVIAHSKPGLHQVYDQYAYFDEKKQALELLSAKLHGIVDPPVQSNVVALRA